MPSIKQKLLLVSFTSLKNAPRPYKQWLALHNSYEITEVAFEPSNRADAFFQLIDKGATSFWQKIYWAITLICGNYLPYLQRYTVQNIEQLQQTTFDLVITHDIKTCPLAFSLANHAPVIIDLHEYLPAEAEEQLFWRIFFQRAVTKLCAQYLPLATQLITVSEGVANEYKRVFNVTAAINYNTPPYIEQHPTIITPQEIKLVHHGVAMPERCIHELLTLMDILPKQYILHLYLVGTGSYYEEIQKKAKQHSQIVWHAPIPMTEISKHFNQYDVGITLLPPINANHQLTIGNKIFEFIQARLAVIAWPTQGIHYVLDKFQVGVCSTEPTVTSIAHTLQALDIETLRLFKQNSDTAAKVLTAEESIKSILQVVSRACAHRQRKEK